jgi:hypothetical protein
VGGQGRVGRQALAFLAAVGVEQGEPLDLLEQLAWLDGLT